MKDFGDKLYYLLATFGSITAAVFLLVCIMLIASWASDLITRLEVLP